MKKLMKRKLTSLATGELVAVLVFWMNFFPAQKMDSYYWILIKRISNPRFAERYTGEIYRILKILDLILLGVGTLIIIFNSSDFSTFIISVAIWFFAVIEWMNYFKWQLSYSLNPAVLLKYILQRKLRKSKLAKEIEKTI